jgi:acetyl-CoA synthetase
MWYREVVGHNRCPIVDTWWQTETGHIMISDSGSHPTKPGPRRDLCPASPEIVTMEGKPVPDGSGGFPSSASPGLGCCAPSMAILIGGVRQYWSQIPGVYFRMVPAKIRTAIFGSWAASTTS